MGARTIVAAIGALPDTAETRRTYILQYAPPCTVAQAWPLLWGQRSLPPERLKATWRGAIASWQGKTPRDGFAASQ